jgi:hypothetical protein
MRSSSVFLRGRRARGLLVAAFAIGLLPLAHCDNGNPTTPPSTAVIGPAGGALASSDYVFEILVPPGALSTAVTFTISPASAPSGALAPAYTITPSTQTFAAPVVLSFTQDAVSYDPVNDLSDYRVSDYSGSWTPLANPSDDPLAYTIEGTTTALTGNPYSVVVPTGGTCVTITEAYTQGDDGGPSSCQPASIPPYGPGKCAAYAGSVANASSCESDGGPLLSISCCYPTGTPICFTQSEPNGCGSPCASYPGATATSCVPQVSPPFDNASASGPPQSTCCFAQGAPVCMASHTAGRPVPTCAGSSPCAAFPGTTVSSCTDVTDGTDAVCCLPVGTLPSTLPGAPASVDGGAPVTGDDGGDAGTGDASTGDASSGDASSGDANTGDANISDANGSGDTGTDAPADAPVDANDDGG